MSILGDTSKYRGQDPQPWNEGEMIVCQQDNLPHEFEIFGRHRKPHCLYCGEIERADNKEDGCYERPAPPTDPAEGSRHE